MTEDTGFIISPKLYDFLKYVAFVILPALATLMLGLGLVFAWSPAQAVAATITLVDTFLGTILGKSATNYKNKDPNVFGDLVVRQDLDGTPTGMKIVGHVENPILEENTQVVLNVKREQDLQ